MQSNGRDASDSYQGSSNELTSISKALNDGNQSQAPEPRQTQNHERKTQPEASVVSATSGYTKAMQSTSAVQHQQARFKSGQQSPPQPSYSLVSNQTARSADDNQGLDPTSQLLRRRRSGAVPPPDRLQKLETQGDYFLTQAFQQSQWSQEDEGEAQPESRLQADENGDRDMDDDDREMDRILAQSVVHEATGDEQDDYFESETPSEVMDGARQKTKNIDGRVDSTNIKAMGRSPTVTIRASATVPTVKLKHEFTSESVRRRVSEGEFAMGRQQQQVYQTATRARTSTQNDSIDLTESTPEAQVLHHMTPLPKTQPHPSVSIPTLISDSQLVRQATTTIGKRRRIIEDEDDDDEYGGTIVGKNGATISSNHRADKLPRLQKQQQQHHQLPQLRSEPYPAILPSKFFSAPSQDGEHPNSNQFSLKRLQPQRKVETSTAADQDLVGSSDLENELDRALGAQRVVHLTDSCRRASDPTPVRLRARTKTRQSLPHPRINAEESIPDNQQLIFMRMLKSLCVASGCSGEQALSAMKQCSGNWRIARRLLCMEREIEEEEAKNDYRSRGTRRISAYAENEKLLKLVWTAEEDALLLGSGPIAQLKLLREKKGAKALLERERFLEKLMSD